MKEESLSRGTTSLKYGLFYKWKSLRDRGPYRYITFTSVTLIHTWVIPKESYKNEKIISVGKQRKRKRSDVVSTTFSSVERR